MITAVALPVATMPEKADAKIQTVTTRVHSDIISMISLIEAMYADLHEKFSRVEFIDSLLRPGTTKLHKKAMDYFKKK